LITQAGSDWPDERLLRVRTTSSPPTPSRSPDAWQDTPWDREVVAKVDNEIFVSFGTGDWTRHSSLELVQAGDANGQAGEARGSPGLGVRRPGPVAAFGLAEVA